MYEKLYVNNYIMRLYGESRAALQILSEYGFKLK